MNRPIVDILIIIAFFACYEVAFLQGANEQMKLDQKKLESCHRVIVKDLYGGNP